MQPLSGDTSTCVVGIGRPTVDGEYLRCGKPAAGQDHLGFPMCADCLALFTALDESQSGSSASSGGES